MEHSKVPTAEMEMVYIYIYMLDINQLDNDWQYPLLYTFSYVFMSLMFFIFAIFQEHDTKLRAVEELEQTLYYLDAFDKQTEKVDFMEFLTYVGLNIFFWFGDI